MRSVRSVNFLRGIAVIKIFFSTFLCSCTFAATPKSMFSDVQINWSAQIPLRDGIHLNANIYRPSSQKDPLPCVFVLTPYTASNGQLVGMYLAQNEYVFASVDSRGRGDSEGIFGPLSQEANDGYDVVEWLAKQPFCTPKVGMLGGSYQGYDQWATAKEAPPHLATIVPVASVHPGVDFPFLHNIAYPYAVQWLMFTNGHTEQMAVLDDVRYWGEKYKELYFGARPLKDFDSTAGKSFEAFQAWMAHPLVDDYWDALSPTAEQFAKMYLPILSITGQYDDDQPGALAYYSDFFHYAPEDARATHYLVIGPWDHGGTRKPKESVGGIKFGPASLVDMNKLRKDWYDWTLKSGQRPEFLKDKVAYYTLGNGAEYWRYTDSLEHVTREKRIFNLDSKQSNPSTTFAAGELVEKLPTSSKPDVYLYDPNDASAISEIDTEEHEGWITDQRWLSKQSGNYLVYQTNAFDRDTDIAGFFQLSAWIALDQPDTDFHVQLFEIQEDGASIFLTEDFMRARYRTSERRAQLVDRGRVLQYDFNHFGFVARRLQKGSRLRLTIAPPAVSPLAGLYMSKNFNSGGVVAQETRDDARVVRVSLYHDSRHRSQLSVPIAR